MLEIYKIIAKFLQIVLNIMFFLQIALMILVFLTAAYWFFDLLNISAFEFAAPLAEGISDFIKSFHQQDIMVGGTYIDSSLLLFDLASIALVFLIAKSKYYLYRALENVNIEIDKCIQKLENEFNKKLQKEAEHHIKQANNGAILVQFEAKCMVMDAMLAENQSPQDIADEAFKIFYAALKNISGCKFAKTDDKMLIITNNFNNIDNLLHFIDLSVTRIRENMKKKRWALFSYIAADVYDNKTNFKQDVYPLLEKLLNLRHKNEAICLGNFTMRYNLNKETMYNSIKKGAYNINGEVEVWSLVKKN